MNSLIAVTVNVAELKLKRSDCLISYQLVLVSSFSFVNIITTIDIAVVCSCQV